MKAKIPFIDQEGVHKIAPDGLFPSLKNFRILAEVLPVKLFVFRFTATNDADPEDFSYEVLINSIDKDLIIIWNGDPGNYLIHKANGKKIKGFEGNTSRVFFTAFPSDANFGADKDFDCLVVQKSTIFDTSVVFATVDATGFALNGVANNELGILVLFDMNTELNTTSQTL
jgi:hypothetical protein